MFVLGALGTGVGYVFQYTLIRGAGATLAMTVTYCIPMVSIALGVIVLGERLTWNAPIGAVVIIAGAMLSRAARRPVEPRVAVDDSPARTRWVRGLG
jgi:drug/metabolite transporter (DMT)-like permease